MNGDNDLCFTYHKLVGETPLQAIERAREERALPPYVKMAYAGRLDPMAEGKLLVLTGDYCNHVHDYWHLDKEYNVSVLLGMSSDSHDVLGRLSYTSPVSTPSPDTIQTTLDSLTGDYAWPYPVISSKPVGGKPLFQWFLEDRLDEIEIPLSTGTIFSIHMRGIRRITPEALKKRTLEKIHSVAIVTDPSKRLGRDFRRHEVIDSWNAWYSSNPDDLTVVDITVTASAGTYMRTLSHELGKALDTGGLALEINRTEIGTYKRFGPLSFWWKRY